MCISVCCFAPANENNKSTAVIDRPSTFCFFSHHIGSMTWIRWCHTHSLSAWKKKRPHNNRRVCCSQKLTAWRNRCHGCSRVNRYVYKKTLPLSLSKITPSVSQTDYTSQLIVKCMTKSIFASYKYTHTSFPARARTLPRAANAAFGLKAFSALYILGPYSSTSHERERETRQPR